MPAIIAKPHAVAHRGLPNGTPPWITPALVERTIAIWQPRSREKLTEDDAIEMLVTVGRLASVLKHPREKVCLLPRGPAREHDDRGE